MLEGLVLSKQIGRFHLKYLFCRELGGKYGQDDDCQGNGAGQAPVIAPDPVENYFSKDEAYDSAQGSSD